MVSSETLRRSLPPQRESWAKCNSRWEVMLENVVAAKTASANPHSRANKDAAGPNSRGGHESGTGGGSIERGGHSTLSIFAIVVPVVFPAADAVLAHSSRGNSSERGTRRTGMVRLAPSMHLRRANAVITSHAILDSQVPFLANIKSGIAIFRPGGGVHSHRSYSHMTVHAAAKPRTKRNCRGPGPEPMSCFKVAWSGVGSLV
jgi:hypothetical protein